MLFCNLAKSRNEFVTFIFLAIGELKAVASVQCNYFFFSLFYFIKSLKECQHRPTIQGQLYPTCLTAFVSSLTLPYLAVFWCHFQFFPPVPFLPGYRDYQCPGVGQVHSGLNSPPHPSFITSLVTLPAVNSEPQEKCYPMEWTFIGNLMPTFLDTMETQV